ncbi:RecB family exonuclease [Acinetobacter sp. BSP-153]|uniref:RecB family exonuclease n=1 Tax=Acinetobacter sp. BSP-153 TaxID=3344663 RepID=UPI00377040A1
MILNFSILESYFKCPYAFKYYTCYGFKEPLEARIGFGKSLHDSLMEIHKKAIEGIKPTKEEISTILEKHINFPYAIPKTKEAMRLRALNILHDYYDQNYNNFEKIEFAEKDIVFDLAEGLIVSGRIDLVIQKDDAYNEKIYIVDFKSKLDSGNVIDRLLKQEIIQKQLILYAIGYKELTGKKADFTQIYDLETQTPINTLIDDQLLINAQYEITQAGFKIKNDDLNKVCTDPSCVCSAIQ